MARRARRQSTAPEVSDWADGLPPRFLLCQDMGHTWQPYTASWQAGTRQYRRALRCSRCHAERVQMLSASGHVESSFYIYPDGYAMPVGAGGYTMATRDLCRLTSVTRAVAQAERRAS